MGTVPTPHTWTAGDDATSTYLQTLTDASLYVLGSATSGGSRKGLARLRQTVAQTLTTATFTAINFDTEDVDYDAAHSTVTNTSRYTAQTAGYYLVSGIAGFVGNATGARYTAIYVNGSPINGTEQGFTTVPNADTLQIPTPGTLVYLNAGDYVQLVAYQSSGGNLNTHVAAAAFQPIMNVLWVSN